MGAPDLKASAPAQLIPGDGYHTLKLSGELVGGVVAALEELRPHLESATAHVVVNCEHVSYLSSDWVRFLLQSQQTLKKHNKGLVLLGVPASLRANFKREGLDAAFKFAATLHEALVGFGLATKKRLDTDFINPFLEATMKVLKVQTRVEATPGKIYIKKSDDARNGDVSGVIGIVSESFNGSVVISFPAATFITLMSNMLGETYSELTPEILDGAGEITNMVFGQAKVVLNAKGHGIKTALPSVVSGKDHSLTALTTGPCVVIPFSCSAGPFFVEICLSA